MKSFLVGCPELCSKWGFPGITFTDGLIFHGGRLAVVRGASPNPYTGCSGYDLGHRG